jgi:hypothetical protein
MGESTPRTPSLVDVLDAYGKQLLMDVHTCMPGQITTWDPVTQKADIKPLIQRRIQHEDGTEAVEALPILPDVPVIFQRSLQFFLSFPLQIGDFVLVHYVEASLDKWLSGGGEDTDPDDFRRHDLTDAVAVPGLTPFSRALKEVHTTNLVMGHEGGLQIHITPTGTMDIKVAGTAGSYVALGDVLQTWYTSTLKVWLDTHVHPTGVGPSGPPAAPASAFDATIVSAVLGIKGP